MTFHHFSGILDGNIDDLHFVDHIILRDISSRTLYSLINPFMIIPLFSVILNLSSTTIHKIINRIILSSFVLSSSSHHSWSHVSYDPMYLMTLFVLSSFVLSSSYDHSLRSFSLSSLRSLRLSSLSSFHHTSCTLECILRYHVLSSFIRAHSLRPDTHSIWYLIIRAFSSTLWINRTKRIIQNRTYFRSPNSMKFRSPRSSFSSKTHEISILHQSSIGFTVRNYWFY